MGVLTNNWSLLMGALATAPSAGANLKNVGVTTCNGTNTVDAEYATTYVNISSSVNKSLTYSGDASATDAKYAQIILGTGTTAPTVDDIKLESILSDDDIDCLEVVSITRTYAETGYGGVIVVAQIRNTTTDTTIKVNELGFIIASPSGVNPILLYRHVFSNTITIEPAEIKQFSLRIY